MTSQEIPVKKYRALNLYVPLFLLAAVQFFCTPILNSGDDAFLMYTLAGGYGEAPTHLLHYNHVWHPLLGWIIKELFTSYPQVNWYTLTLLGVHFVALIFIYHAFIRRTGLATGSLMFFIFFFFFEIRFLLTPSFTSTAFVGACGTLMNLVLVIDKDTRKWKKTLPAILLVVVAGLLRLQIAWLVMILFLPYALPILTKEKRTRWLIFFGSAAILLFVLNTRHENFYRKQIPGWEQQENFRQALFYGYNRPVKADPSAAFRDSTEMQLFFSGFLYDDPQFNTKRLKEISEHITRKRLLDEKEDRQGIYWLFMEIRVYLVLFGVFIISLIIQKKKSILRRWVSTLIMVVLIYGGLFVLMKITPPIHIGLLMILWLHLAGHFNKEDNLFPDIKWQRLAGSLVLVLAFCWMGIRVFSENKINIKKRAQFYCALGELNKDQSRLFIATDDNFPLSYFYTWDVPRDYPVTNLIYKDRLLAGTYKYTLDRFGMTAVDSSIVDRDFVYLLGNLVPAVGQKFVAKYTGRFPAYKCLQVRKLIPFTGSW